MDSLIIFIKCELKNSGTCKEWRHIMFRYSNSTIDHVRDSIIQCMSVSGHQAYELGGVLLMEFQNEIPELTSLDSIFMEQYMPDHDKKYNNGIRRVEAMLRKYRTKLESIESKRITELNSTKAELKKETSLREKTEQEVLDWKAKTKLAEEEYMHLREKLDDTNREYRNLQVSHQVLAEENNRLHAENSRLKDEIIMLRKDIDELKAGKDKG